MMNRLMTVKVALYKTEKTGSRQAAPMRRQISFFNRQTQLVFFGVVCLQNLTLEHYRSLRPNFMLNDTDWTAHLHQSFFFNSNIFYLRYLNRILCLLLLNSPEK